MAIEKEKLVDMYRVMVRIRTFEERVSREKAAGRVPGPVCLYTGEEAIATGACASLRLDDYILSTHRGRGHIIAKGGKTNRVMAELFGKKTGYNKGKGGAMHVAEVDMGILGANGIVGAAIPIAGGAALAAQMRGTDQVTVCFFGDGACNTSKFHEGINLGSTWKLPVIYVVENNMYGASVPFAEACNTPDLAGRAASYGIPGVTVDGNDIIAVYEAVGEAVARARRGEGPTLIECKTCRQAGHYEGDTMTYRTKKELEECKKGDPIPRFRKKLVEMGILTGEEADGVYQEVAKEVDEAVKFAIESPLPAPEEALEDVYA